MNQNNFAVSVCGLTASYGGRPVLQDINISIPRGVLSAIIGPNGAGKTTLIKAMLGLKKPISGSISFGGDTKTAQIAYVPQTGSINWDFPTTVLDTVIMGCYGHLGWLRRPGKKEKALALKILERVGMSDFADRHISLLSGGQQQRVFLARALIQQADILLLDEPFKGVDVKTEGSIIALLKGLRDEGKTIIVVHHNLQTVCDYFDFVTIINQKVIANGPVDKAFNKENLSLAYASGVETSKGDI